MRKNFRLRFWLIAGLAVFTGFLAMITPVFPDWIEFLSGWDPDHHNGSVERLIVVGLFIVTALLIALGAVEWRRTELVPRDGLRQ